MLANFLNKTKPINFIGLLIFFLISFIYLKLTTTFADSFTLEKLFNSFVFIFIFLGIFFIYNFIVSKNKLTFDNSYAYYIFTLLVIIILPEITSYKALGLTLVFFLFLRKIYSLHSLKSVLQKLFDSGFWLGVCFLLEPFTILFFILIFIGIYLHKKITFRTLFSPILGFLVPLLLYYTYYFWKGSTKAFYILFKFNTKFSTETFSQSNMIWLTIGVLVFTFLSIIFKSSAAFSVSNLFRRSWFLLIVNLIIAIFISLILPDKNRSEFIFIFFPASVIIANGVELIQKKILKNIVLYLLLAGCIFYRFLL